MISVRSPRQRLSGSKFTLVVLLFLTLAYGCRSSRSVWDGRNTAEREIDVTDTTQVNTDTTAEVRIPPVDTAQIIAVDSMESDKGELDSLYRKRKMYRVVMLLPFQEDSLREVARLSKNSKPEDDPVHYPPTSLQAIDFYKGFQLALEEVDDSVSIHLHLFDTDEGPAELIAQLNALPQKPHIVVGPRNLSTAKGVATWCAMNDVVMVSPFLPSYGLLKSTPKYINLYPTLYAHLDAMANRIINDDEAAYVLLVHAGDEAGQRLASRMVSTFNQSGSDADHLVYSDVTLAVANGRPSNVSQIKDYLVQGVKNEIFVFSNNAIFVNHILSYLQIQNRRYDLTMNMLPMWVSNSRIQEELFNAMPTVGSTSDRIHYDDEMYKEWKGRFVDRYDMRPDANAALGYDVCFWLLASLADRGLDICKNLDYIEYDGLVRDFHFGPIVGMEDSIRPLGNDAIHVFKLEDFKRVWLDMEEK